MNTQCPIARRGMAVIVIVVILAVLSLAMVGSVRPVRQETGGALLKVQTVRALYAAESGVIVLLVGSATGLGVPDSGDSVVLGQQTVSFETVPDGAGTAVVTGSSGGARRRVSIDFE